MEAGTLLLVGGVFHLGMAIFHLLFARIFHWDRELPTLGFVNRQLLPVMNLCLTFGFLEVGYLSLAYSGELLSTAITDGLTDAAYNLVMEQRSRPEHERSPRTMERWATEITRTLQYIETRMDRLGDGVTLAHIALAAAVGYLDFRLPDLLRESGCTHLLGWYDSFRERPAMQATQPG